MKTRYLAGAILGLTLALDPAWAADDPVLARMATCQDSWLDWSKTARPKLQQFSDHLHAIFVESGNNPYVVPKTSISVAGLRITQAFPDSVGMGVGFSLTVDASYDTTKKIMEAALGKKLTKCEGGEGMHSCELTIADQRTFMVMADDNDNTKTLIGCYYYYEK